MKHTVLVLTDKSFYPAPWLKRTKKCTKKGQGVTPARIAMYVVKLLDELVCCYSSFTQYGYFAAIQVIFSANNFSFAQMNQVLDDFGFALK